MLNLIALKTLLLSSISISAPGSLMPKSKKITKDFIRPDCVGGA